MKNIIWQRPDGGISVTTLVNATDSQAEAERLKATGSIPADWTVRAYDSPPPVNLADVQLTLANAVQMFMDSKAKERGYDSILSASSYAGYANPFQAESQTFLAWRGNCWQYCYQQLAAVQAGQRGIPTAAQLIAELPALVF